MRNVVASLAGAPGGQGQGRQLADVNLGSFVICRLQKVHKKKRGGGAKRAGLVLWG
jgi:hypothetical protein